MSTGGRSRETEGSGGSTQRLSPKAGGPLRTPSEEAHICQIHRDRNRAHMDSRLAGTAVTAPRRPGRHPPRRARFVIQLNQALQFRDERNASFLIIWQHLQTPRPTYPFSALTCRINDILAGVPPTFILTPAVAGDLMGIRDQARWPGDIKLFPPSPTRESTIAQVTWPSHHHGLLGG